MYKQWIHPEVKGQLVTAGRATRVKELKGSCAALPAPATPSHGSVIHHEAEKLEALESRLSHSTFDQVKYPFKDDTITAGTQSTHQCVTRVSGYSTSSQQSTERRLVTHRNAVAQQYSVPGRSRQWSHSLSAAPHK